MPRQSSRARERGTRWPRPTHLAWRTAAALAMLVWVRAAAAQFDADLPEPLQLGPVELHGQATYIRQFKPSFPAAYSGPNSLSAEKAYSWSLTGTLFFGARITDTLEVYV